MHIRMECDVTGDVARTSCDHRVTNLGGQSGGQSGGLCSVPEQDTRSEETSSGAHFCLIIYVIYRYWYSTFHTTQPCSAG